MEELIGKTLGQYRIETKIGSGGMATVFKAYQLSLDRHVAIKVLPPSFASQNPTFAQRFEREAKAIARLHHPNILPVYDFGIDHDYSYIVMRYVEGAQTLGQLIPYSLRTEWLVYLISQVANALAYAHQRGVVHRDVKPNNILLDGEWVMLSDFGLAKVGEAVAQLTDIGKSIGTPAYMSPEQARGELVDHRSDIYSLGIILYEMLTHKIPHDAPTPLGIMLKRTTQPPPPPRSLNPAISESMEQVILRALALQPEDRYDSAADYALALNQALVNDTAGQLPDRKTYVIDPPDFTRFRFKKKESFTQKLLAKGRKPLWLSLAGLGVTAVVLALGQSSFLPPTGASQPTTVVAVAPTATTAPAVNPTLTPRATPTSRPPSDTPTPSPTPLSSDTPVLFTPTPIIVVVTATATPSPTPTPSPSPTSTPTVTVTPTSTATPNPLQGTFVLLNPSSLEKPSYGPTEFEWQWDGTLPPGFGFEVRVWREGAPPVGAHNAVLDNQAGRIERIGENRYRIKLDIRDAAGVRGRTGIYLWTVALVQISPTYAAPGLQAEPTRLRFESGGNNDGGKDGGGVGIS
jgi:serine/threonine-protein kinase